jgi:hypothetical protein
MERDKVDQPPFAPPFLKAGRLLIALTANILMFLGSRHRLAPAGEAGCLFAHLLQLTVADLVQEVHDTQPPDLERALLRRPAAGGEGADRSLPEASGPKILGYFESILERKGNISSEGERIDHVPGGQDYDLKKIDTSKGDRGFCSELRRRRVGGERRATGLLRPNSAKTPSIWKRAFPSSACLMSGRFASSVSDQTGWPRFGS